MIAEVNHWAPHTHIPNIHMRPHTHTQTCLHTHNVVSQWTFVLSLIKSHVTASTTKPLEQPISVFPGHSHSYLALSFREL